MIVIEIVVEIMLDMLVMIVIEMVENSMEMLEMVMAQAYDDKFEYSFIKISIFFRYTRGSRRRR